MAIDTNDKKLAVMEMETIWEPGIVLDETSPFAKADKQQLLWGYPGVLWLDSGAIDVTGLGTIYVSAAAGITYVSSPTGTIN